MASSAVLGRMHNLSMASSCQEGARGARLSRFEFGSPSSLFRDRYFWVNGA
jgi:hypothetical protein